MSHKGLTDRTKVHIARLVLETRTPLSIGQGRGDGIQDQLLVRDANGLPALPGSSFAGVLRAVFQQAFHDKDRELRLFGRRGGEADFQGASRVTVSWGCIHDGGDRPVEGLILGEAWEQRLDPVLLDSLLDAPVRRNRVRMDHRGCASDQGLFTRTALTAGHRFSIELALWSNDDDPKDWRDLLQLLTQPDFRLGGGVHSGLGALAVVRLYSGTFDLKQPGDFQRYSDLSASLADCRHLKEQDPEPAADTCPRVTLTLQPEDFYRFGQGFEALMEQRESGEVADDAVKPAAPNQAPKMGHPRPDHAKMGHPRSDRGRHHRHRSTSRGRDGDHRPKAKEGLVAEKVVVSAQEPKLLPLSEKRIQWEPDSHAGGKDRAVLSERLILIPASAVKGALRHRLTYHDNIMRRRFAELEPGEDADALHNPAARCLFGFAADEVTEQDVKEANDKETEVEEKARPVGCVLMDDLYLSLAGEGEHQGLQHLNHNGIDAFTGGVRQHVLYTEEVIASARSLTLTLTITNGHRVPQPTREVLARTLADLTEGRLALGAGGSRGHGYFTGTQHWRDGGAWIKGDV